MEKKLPYYASVNKSANLLGVSQAALSSLIRKNSPAYYDKSMKMVDLNHPEWIAYVKKKRMRLSGISSDYSNIEKNNTNDSGGDISDDESDDDGIDYEKIDQITNYSELRDLSKLNVMHKMLTVEKLRVELSIKKKKLIDRSIFTDTCFGYLVQLSDRLLTCSKNLAVDIRSMVLGGKTNDDVEDFIHREIGAIIEQTKKTITKTLNSV